MMSFNFPEFYNNLIGEIHTNVQAAEVMGCNVQYLRRLLRAGKPAGIKVGQVWLIGLVSLSAYIQQTEEVAAKGRLWLATGWNFLLVRASGSQSSCRKPP